jgi:hypothetical protein
VPREEEGKKCGILRLERKKNNEEYSRKKQKRGYLNYINTAEAIYGKKQETGILGQS